MDVNNVNLPSFLLLLLSTHTFLKTEGRLVKKKDLGQIPSVYLYFLPSSFFSLSHAIINNVFFLLLLFARR